MAKVTIKDVAAESGVSIATVSRVMNNNLSVAPELSQKVLAAAKSLGYHVGAAPVPANRGDHIAILVPYLGSSYFTEIVEGVIDTARKNGQDVTVMISKADPEQELQRLRSLPELAVSGVIFAGGSDRDPLESVPALKNIPLVIAARRQIVKGVPHVYSDNENAGYMAAKYLLRMQRRRIALFVNFWANDIHDYATFIQRYNSSARGSCTSFDRYTGYCRALQEEGVPLDPSLIVFSGFTPESGYAACQKLLGSACQFDAVLVANDRCATGVMKILHEQGLRVPSDVSIICFNGGLIANVVTPSLTMVEQNNYALGCAAAEQLNALVHDQPTHDVKIDVNLVINGSTSLAVGEN